MHSALASATFLTLVRPRAPRMRKIALRSRALTDWRGARYRARATLSAQSVAERLRHERFSPWQMNARDEIRERRKIAQIACATATNDARHREVHDQTRTRQCRSETWRQRSSQQHCKTSSSESESLGDRTTAHVVDRTRTAAGCAVGAEQHAPLPLRPVH